jgi:spore maturation protein CgeB
MKLVFLGLSFSSSWGNGHATTYRALIKGLHLLGHEVTFLERDVPWYAKHRDATSSSFCRLEFYRSLSELVQRHGPAIAAADAVVVGSYVPEGVAVIRLVREIANGVVAFYDIDTPVTLARLAKGGDEHLVPALVPIFDVYFSFTSGPSLDRLEGEFGARKAVALHCMVDPELYRPAQVPVRYDLGYLGTYSADRQPALERLLIQPARHLPAHRFVVAGAQYPRDIAWPDNVERLEHVAPVDHPRFYGSMRFTLNVTRADMVAAGHSPSVRLFEAAACGTPLISDRWAGLDRFFPETSAIIVADRCNDVIRALTEIGEEHVSAMAARARAITLASHTGTSRASTLEAEIEAQMSSTQTRRLAKTA